MTPRPRMDEDPIRIQRDEGDDPSRGTTVACGGASARRLSGRRRAAASKRVGGFRSRRFSQSPRSVKSSAGGAGEGGRAGDAGRDWRASAPISPGDAARAICRWIEEPTLASANGQTVPKMPSSTPMKTRTERWAAREPGTAARTAHDRADSPSSWGPMSRDARRTPAVCIWKHRPAGRSS